MEMLNMKESEIILFAIFGTKSYRISRLRLSNTNWSNLPMTLKGIFSIFKKDDWNSRKPKIKIIPKINGKDWRMQKAKIQMGSEVRNFRNHLSQNFWTLAISTFGIANGLVWYDVWNTLVSTFFPNRNGFLTKVYVAIIVTLFSITATYIVTKVRDRNGT